MSTAEARWGGRFGLEQAALNSFIEGRSDGLLPSHFTDPRNRFVFEVVRDLKTGGTKEIETPIILEGIRQRGRWEDESWPIYVDRIRDTYPLDVRKELELHNRAGELRKALSKAVALLDAPGGSTDLGATLEQINAELRASLSSPQSTEWFQTYDVGHLIREGVPPIEWDIEDFLPAQTVTYLTGIWKGGKTWLSLVWTILLSTGGSFCDLKSRGGQRVLFVEAEYPRQIPIRIRDLCLGFQIDPEKVLQSVRFVIPTPGKSIRLENPACVEALIREAKGFRANRIILDSLRRLTGADENSSKEMAAVADIGLLPLRDVAECGVLVLDHPSKPSQLGKRAKKLEGRGTGDKIAACDHQIHLDNFETPTGKVYAVSTGASRVAPERDEPLYLRLRSTPNGGVRFEETEEPQDNSGGRPPTAREKALMVIKETMKREPRLTYSRGIAACLEAGLSESTGKRAWAELREKVQGSEGSEP